MSQVNVEVVRRGMTRSTEPFLEGVTRRDGFSRAAVLGAVRRASGGQRRGGPRSGHRVPPEFHREDERPWFLFRFMPVWKLRGGKVVWVYDCAGESRRP